MKRIFLFSISAMISGILLAGGIVTNQNQSTQYTRLQARDATLGIDAVFFNPAGLNFLPNDGFHLSLSNQSIWQTRTINSDYSSLNNSEYIGDVKAPLFPGVYAAYKTGKFAFSFGFNPIGGGGGGIYETGLPSFEYDMSDLPPTLQGALLPVDQGVENVTSVDPGFRNVSGYSRDVYFEGTSVFFGYQANVSYQISEILSVAIGGRYVIAKETYQGHIRDIHITPPTQYGVSQSPGDYLRFVGAQTGQSASLNPVAGVFDALTADKTVDVERTGSGFTPILGINLKASDKLNLAFKYEHQTKIELETKVLDSKDGGGLYEDGKKDRADLPSLIVLGATYKPTDKLLISTGFHYYLDKGAEYGKTKEDTSGVIVLKNTDILDNAWEFAIGVEYAISEKILVSLGYLRNNSNVDNIYQTDLNHILSGNTIGGGFEYKLSPVFSFDLAASYTKYDEGTKSLEHTFTAVPVNVPVKETYNKENLVIAIGLNFNFSAGK